MESVGGDKVVDRSKLGQAGEDFWFGGNGRVHPERAVGELDQDHAGRKKHSEEPYGRPVHDPHVFGKFLKDRHCLPEGKGRREMSPPQPENGSMAVAKEWCEKRDLNPQRSFNSLGF